MSKHYASAKWNGNLAKGTGTYQLKTSGHQEAYGFSSRFEDNKKQSSPEELIGAACASCFSMALSHSLDQAGFHPESVQTNAEVKLDKVEGGFGITGIHLKTSAKVKDIDRNKFMEIANDAKVNCPISQALKAVPIHLDAELV